MYKNYNSFGGAQYVIRNVNTLFWEKHEKDCEEIYQFLTRKLAYYKHNRIEATELSSNDIDIDFTYFQIWCTDMWSMVLNAHFFGYEIELSTELNFCWPKQPIDEWYKTKIMHNSGVNKEDAFELFYKGFYKEYSPYTTKFSYVNQYKCSSKYVEEILDTIKNKRYKYDDFVIFLLIRIDSQDRLRNLKLFLQYVIKYFDVKIQLWEIYKNPKIEQNIIDAYLIQYKFIEDDNVYLHRTKYFNIFANSTSYNLIGYLDCDCIFKPENLKECIDSVREEYTIALPFDNRFININNKKVINQFADNLDISLLKDDSSNFSLPHSVGGGVIINKSDFLQIGGENEEIVGWGTDDIDRVFKVLINGKKVFRSKGDLYHLDHHRNPLSRSEIDRNVTQQINKYII
ncbi:MULTISPECIES: galactosyltransferase-related protein [Sphingobacterium]|uniref:galactosyltransferase-related protein n=1 Tax=Sphingobacterium TaxID=28453 RepID=UPI0013DCD7E1|nr:MULTISPECIES: galactosyltransferase-related protein [unclassified Sphingobacterium]